jgi:hypothetical protein
VSAATPARRGVADLPLSWATASEASRLAGVRGGGEARAAAHAAFHALPTESNLLFTGYVDLRSANTHDTALLTPSSTISELPASELPDGAAAVISISARGVAAHLGAEARAAGLTVEPLSGETPLAGAESDRMTALIAAYWGCGIQITLASGTIDAPIVIKVESPAQGEALVARIGVTLGDGASATISEEVVGPRGVQETGTGAQARAPKMWSICRCAVTASVPTRNFRSRWPR